MLVDSHSRRVKIYAGYEASRQAAAAEEAHLWKGPALSLHIPHQELVSRRALEAEEEGHLDLHSSKVLQPQQAVWAEVEELLDALAV